MSIDIPRQIFPRLDKTTTRSKFDKNQKKFSEYRQRIRDCGCIIAGCNADAQCAHLRFSSAEYGKFNPGVGSKPHDKFSLPLCQWHHLDAPDAQHKQNEQEFWSSYSIDPLAVAASLWEARDSLDDMQKIVQEVRNRG